MIHPVCNMMKKKSSIAGIFLVNSPKYTSNLYILHKCTSCIYVQLNFKPNSSYLENWMGCLYNRGTLKAIFCKNDQVQRIVFFVLVIKNQNPTIMYICDICSVDVQKKTLFILKTVGRSIVQLLHLDRAFQAAELCRKGPRGYDWWEDTSMQKGQPLDIRPWFLTISITRFFFLKTRW